MSVELLTIQKKHSIYLYTNTHWVIKRKKYTLFSQQWHYNSANDTVHKQVMTHTCTQIHKSKVNEKLVLHPTQTYTFPKPTLFVMPRQRKYLKVSYLLVHRGNERVRPHVLASGNKELVWNCISGYGENPIGGILFAPVATTRMSSVDILKDSVSSAKLDASTLPCFTVRGRDHAIKWMVWIFS